MCPLAPLTNDMLCATQTIARSYIRAGIPVLDMYGWLRYPLANGFRLLSAHDAEFVFNDAAKLLAYMLERKAIMADVEASMRLCTHPDR
jgi:hypothetical protein